MLLKSCPVGKCLLKTKPKTVKQRSMPLLYCLYKTFWKDLFQVGFDSWLITALLSSQFPFNEEQISKEYCKKNVISNYCKIVILPQGYCQLT